MTTFPTFAEIDAIINAIMEAPITSKPETTLTINDLTARFSREGHRIRLILRAPQSWGPRFRRPPNGGMDFHIGMSNDGLVFCGMLQDSLTVYKILELLAADPEFHHLEPKNS